MPISSPDEPDVYFPALRLGIDHIRDGELRLWR